MSKSMWAIIPSLILILLTVPRCRNRGLEWDLLIQGGLIIDGTDSSPRRGDIGVRGETIVFIGQGRGDCARRILDARGLHVCPGFIDVHTHSDRGFGKADTAANINYISQGVTTVVAGNCGASPLDVAACRAAWEKQGMGVNSVLLVGLGSLRYAVMGIANRDPLPSELADMQERLRRALRDGAWGLSTGLPYIPDRYARKEEILALARIVAEVGGVYSSHIRDEGAGLAEAVEETIRIAAESGARVNISHLKASGTSNWGRMAEAVRLIGEAKSRGVKISADLYPYDRASIVPFLMSFNVPPNLLGIPELRDGYDFYYVLSRLGAKQEDLLRQGRAVPDRKEWLSAYADRLNSLLRNPEARAAIRDLTLAGAPDLLNWVPIFGWDNFVILRAGQPGLIGRTVAEIARERRQDPFDTAADLFLQERQALIMSVCSMSEADIELALKQEWLMISSDGGAARYGIGDVHPRYYGSAARILGRYVRDRKILPLHEAVRRMTSLPAEWLNLKDRGVLRRGAKADIVVFDPELVRDNATYDDPHRFCSGIQYVILNGQVSIDGGAFTGALAGRLLLSTADRAQASQHRRGRP